MHTEIIAHITIRSFSISAVSLVILTVAVRLLAKSIRTSDPKNCRICGYDVSGIPITSTGKICPECGKSPHLPAVRAHWKRLSNLFIAIGMHIIAGLGLVVAWATPSAIVCRMPTAIRCHGINYIHDYDPSLAFDVIVSLHNKQLNKCCYLTLVQFSIDALCTNPNVGMSDVASRILMHSSADVAGENYFFALNLDWHDTERAVIATDPHYSRQVLSALVGSLPNCPWQNHLHIMLVIKNTGIDDARQLRDIIQFGVDKPQFWFYIVDIVRQYGNGNVSIVRDPSILGNFPNGPQFREFLLDRINTSPPE